MLQQHQWLTCSRVCVCVQVNESTVHECAHLTIATSIYVFGHVTADLGMMGVLSSFLQAVSHAVTMATINPSITTFWPVSRGE